MIKIFISHSSNDADFVSLITDLIVDAVPDIRKDEIRCTSVPGFRLPIGVHTSSQLRTELNQCQVLIGVLTVHSLASSYVLFELGAGWGMKKTVLPIMGPNTPYSDLRPPLSELHAISYTNRNAWYQFIETLAKSLELSAAQPVNYSHRIDKLAEYRHP